MFRIRDSLLKSCPVLFFSFDAEEDFLGEKESQTAAENFGFEELSNFHIWAAWRHDCWLNKKYYKHFHVHPRCIQAENFGKSTEQWRQDVALASSLRLSPAHRLLALCAGNYLKQLLEACSGLH